ncbi:MAG TPA: aldehyde dehydrogenase family protein [Phycisphaerales bacterium]|nr:aldehyde dehydrogenase family protein [Phycisphaerales bacterium]
MTNRLPITKTYKLFIGGKFPRTESGRSVKVCDASGAVVAHTCRASRKDLRNAVEAAVKAQPGWAGANAYLRGQILYRMAEMVEGKRVELADAVAAVGGVSDDAARGEVDAATDRLIAFAGWADKFPQVLGCHNPVTGPYYNFSVPEPTGVIGVICPDEPSLLGLVSLIAPVLCSGNAAVVLASESNPIPACVLGEVLATSDVPGGVVNILTGLRDELAEHFASHREIGGVLAAGVSADHRRLLEAGAAENMKRVRVLGDATDFGDDAAMESPWQIEPFVETKTIWHPASA